MIEFLLLVGLEEEKLEVVVLVKVLGLLLVFIDLVGEENERMDASGLCTNCCIGKGDVVLLGVSI